MAFKYQGVDFSNIIYGVGTQTSVNGFATAVVSSNYRIGGTSMRVVPRNALYMPYSANSIFGYKSGGAEILTYSAFAGVGRFITSVTENITKSGDSTSKIPIYYVGGGTLNSFGRLYIGGSATQYDTGYSVPPVILIAICGAGGNGGRGVKASNITGGWILAGGGGGGSAGFSCYQVELPYSATVPTLVGYYRLNGYAELYAGSNVSPFCTVNKAGDGGDGVAELTWLGSVGSLERGSAGVRGSVSAFSTPSGFTNMNIFDGVQYTYALGASGGRGGTTTNRFTGTFYFAGSGGGYGNLVWNLNNGSSGSRPGRSGASRGSANPDNRGGGGAGGIIGAGGGGLTAYGSGGNGGHEGSGTSGGRACVKIFW